MRRPEILSGKDRTDRISSLPGSRNRARIFTTPSTAPTNPAMM